MTTLPPRPYVVSPKFIRRSILRATLLFFFGVCGIAGSVWFTRHAGHKILDDQAVWADGVFADEPHISGRSTSHEFIINEYDLTTEYSDAAGATHRGSTSFELLFSSITSGSRVSLKYDRENPDRHTVSWAIEHVPARWGFVGFMDLAFGGLFGAALLYLGSVQVRLIAHARMVAHDSDEVALEVVSIKPILVKGRHTANLYVYEHAGRQAKQKLPTAELPLFTDEKRTHLVALVSSAAPDRPWIVRADNAPFQT